LNRIGNVELNRELNILFECHFVSSI